MPAKLHDINRSGAECGGYECILQIVRAETVGFYVNRIAGRYCNYRHLGGTVVADPGQVQTGGVARLLTEQPQAAYRGCSFVRGRQR
jgi:hypothetical protein